MSRPDYTHSGGRQLNWRRILRDFIVLGLLGCAHLYLLVSILLRPERLRAGLQSELGRRLHSPVEIGSLELTPLGLVRVEGVRTLSKHAPGAHPRFKASRISIQVDPWELIRGRLEVRTIEVSRPELILDLAGLPEQTQPFSRITAGRASASRAIHDISIKNATITLLHVPSFGEDEVFRMDGISAKISHIQGLHRGLRITGDISNDWLPRCGYRLDIDERASTIHGDINAGRVAISQELFQHLPLSIREVLGSYNLSGEFNLSLGFRLNWRTREAEELGLRAELRNCQGTHERLPYAVTGLRGRLQTDGKNLNVRDVSAHVGPTSVRLSGHRLHDGDEVEESWNIRIDDLALNETLRAKLEGLEGAARLWAQLNPSGHLAAHLRLARRGTEKFSVTADIQSDDLQLIHHRFAYPARIAKARVEWDGRICRIHDLQASAGEAQVVLNGETGAARGSPKYFHYRLTNALLDDQFRQAMEEKSQRIWDKLSPSGQASGEYEFSRDREGRRLFKVKVTGAQAKLRYQHFPLLVDVLGGSAAWDKETLLLSDVRLQNGKTTFRVDGECSTRKPKEGDRLTVTMEDVPLQEHIREALGPGGQAVWDELRPEGEVDATMELQGQDSRRWRYRLNLTAGSPTISYRRFPYALNVSQCSVEWDERSVRILKGECTSGGAAVSVTGEFARSKDGMSTLRFDFENLPLDTQLRDALPERARPVWDSFKVDGPVEGALEVKFSREGHPRYDLRLESDRASVAYLKLPVPIKFDLIHLAWDPDVFELKQLTGKTSGGTVQLSGAVPLELGAKAAVNIVAEDLGLSPELRDAFPSVVQKVWKDFQFAGTADLESKLSWKVGGAADTSYTVTVSCKDVSACFRGFPAPLSKLAGKVIVSNDGVKVPKLQGLQDASPIRIDGTVAWPKEGVAPDLTIHAERVALDRKLYELLPDAHKSAWNDLSPTGMATVIEYRLLPAASGQIDHQFIAHLEGASLTYVRFPLPLSNVTARCAWKDGAMKIEELKGSVLGGSIEGAARVRSEGLDLSFRGHGLRFGGDLFSALPRAVKEYYAALEPDGRYDMSADIKFLWGTDEPRTSFEAEAKLNEVDAVLGLAVKDVTGMLRLKGAVLGEKLKALAGTVDFNKATVQGHDLQDVTAAIGWDKGTFQVKELRATYHEGLLRADIARNDETVVTQAKLSFANVDIADFSQGFGSGSKIAGTLRGDAEFTVEGGDIKTLRGNGKAFIDGDDLWRLPSLDAITGMLKGANQNRVRQVEMEFGLEGPKLDADFLKLVGDQYNIYGYGTITFDWVLDLTLFVASRSFLTRVANLFPVGPLKPVGKLLEKIQASLMQLEMKGPAKTAKPRSVPLKSSLPSRLFIEIRKDGKKQ